MSKYILAIDQGTSGTKSLVFDEKGQSIAKGSATLHTNFLAEGFVEQDPEAIYSNVLTSVKECLVCFENNGFQTTEIAAMGISNQRETFVIWDKHGKPLHPAIVWQCKRSVQVCEQLKEQGLSGLVQEKTGLVIDPYFSATKLIWLLQNNEQISTAIREGNAYFGTIDTWLLYKFTNGTEYVTDHTNASRTLLFNLHTLQWDHELINIFGLRGINLPSIKSSAALFGETSLNGLLPANVAIAALIGDSHAAAFGEGCFQKGMAKATLGTGCSLLMNIGDKPIASSNGMVTTVCWSIDGRIDYALEGVIVSCGATINWLKNELGLFNNSGETAAMADDLDSNEGVYLVPAFSGLGSPHWQMDRKASITGITFGTTKKHLVRAALESIAFQVCDVVVAMEKDAGISLKELMTDGGITSNNFVLQFIADLLNKSVASTKMPDVSALGAAYMAGLASGIYENIQTLKTFDRFNTVNTPGKNVENARNAYIGWQHELLQSRH
ncbi:MAG: glycerol kinase GlpK [Bacteroidota bacterium]